MDEKLLCYKNNQLLLRYITELKHTQQSLEEEVLSLEMQNDELNTFAYTVAHQLKNPLSSMIGFSSLADQYFDQMRSDDVRENVRATIEIGQNMTNIIDGLLLLGKMEHATDLDTEIDSLDMHSIIERVILSLNNPIRECRAHIHLPENWPTAKGYAGWVEEIWMNYISNAIKYGGSPPVIRLGADAPDNGHVHFWVQDNGQGLSSDEQQRIFRPFVRLKKQEIRGNGLGLMIVKKIVERLDGSISLESEVGKGSRFGFTLQVPEFAYGNELAVMNGYLR